MYDEGRENEIPDDELENEAEKLLMDADFPADDLSHDERGTADPSASIGQRARDNASIINDIYAARVLSRSSNRGGLPFSTSNAQGRGTQPSTNTAQGRGTQPSTNTAQGRGTQPSTNTA